ncbi:28S ribosomal protein S35, mitochondrial [Thrips palmi]|uniref:28S ribosomal protein S35, mitochondrial n=1 Tax=Thrips palmi TaxID=161013 RepID=A0A6P9A8S9_THRPL|nr:28S ribosomal protein S35, mitochondrial [Thrips palmi]
MSLLSFPKMPLKGFKPVRVQLVFNHVARLASSKSYDPKSHDESEFRQLEIRPVRRDRKTSSKARMMMPRDYKRTNNIDPDKADWKSIWPGPRSFDPNSIPIPVRQGRLKPYRRAFDKYANMELMKIPSFFHIPPTTIKAQCEAIKSFCTPFPNQLNSKEKCEEHFPLTVITNDYLHSAPTIRDPLARIVTIKLKLKNIPLDEHARDKFMRLVRDRYDDKTDTLTIVTDRCPLRKQNYDYAQYLLTACFFESWTVEDWESEKTEADMEKYIWENNISAKALASIVKWSPDKLGKSIFHDTLPADELKPEHLVLGAAVKKVIEGETEEGIEEYKKAAMEVLLSKKAVGLKA